MAVPVEWGGWSAYDIVAPPNVHPLLVGPVSAGLCGIDAGRTLTLDDVLDLNEILIARAENERRATDHANRQRSPR